MTCPSGCGPLAAAGPDHLRRCDRCGHYEGEIIHVAWDPAARRNRRVPAGTPGAIEMTWAPSLGRFVTIPTD
jgi:hypothetical protein